MSLMLTLKRIQHKILRHQQLVTYATGNKSVLYPSLWYLFYDVDHPSQDDLILLKENMVYWYQNNWFMLRTKHGFAVVATIAKPLAEVRDQFTRLKRVIKTDYNWEIPLWLRISPKWDMNGNEISPAPEVYENPSNVKDPILWLQTATMPRKLYYTWD